MTETLNETLSVARSYLESKHTLVRVTSIGDIICDGEFYYSPRRVRGSAIWLSAARLEQLKKRNAILLAVDTDKIVEIPVSSITGETTIDGITIKIVSDIVRVKISRDLKNRLSEISSSIDEAIRTLLDVYDRVLQTPAVGLTNEALAFRACLAIAKYRPLSYINLMRKLVMSGEVKLKELSDEEVEIIKELASNRIVFIDNRYDGEYAKLLCTFEVIEKPDEITFKMIYNKDFCRIYCFRYDVCDIKQTDSDSWGFGFVVNYTPEEFKKKPVEELVAKWIGECMQEF